MIYTVAQLDAMPLEVVLGVDRDDTIIDFQKEFWKPKWIEVAGYWMEDPDSFHDIAVEGFRGWVDRTAMEIYLDLRITFIEGQEDDWDSLAEECNDMGKYS